MVELAGLLITFIVGFIAGESRVQLWYAGFSVEGKASLAMPPCHTGWGGGEGLKDALQRQAGSGLVGLVQPAKLGIIMALAGLTTFGQRLWPHIFNSPSSGGMPLLVRRHLPWDGCPDEARCSWV